MTAGLFLVTALFWGAAAIVTTTQAAGAAASISVALRMFLVSGTMLGVAVMTGKPIRIPRAQYLWVTLQGVLFFGLAFIAFYQATQAIPSGVAALVLSSAPFFTAFVAWMLSGLLVSRRALAGIGCGFAGLAIVAAPQLLSLGLDGHTAKGFGWAVLAAASTGTGTALSAHNRRNGVPVIAQLGWGALAGAGFAVLWSAAIGVPFTITPSADFLLGLAYLALVASCATFLMYFTLVGRIGPARAAYVLSLVPLVALTFSVLFEGLQFEPRLIAGAAAILIGNILVLGN